MARKSQLKAHSMEQIPKLTEPQAEARLAMQLYPLTLVDSVEYPLDAAEMAALSASESDLTRMQFVPPAAVLGQSTPTENSVPSSTLNATPAVEP